MAYLELISNRMARNNIKNLSEKCAARGVIDYSGDERQAFYSQIFDVSSAKRRF